ncbi:diguanylate cyclase domain-containing protein [Idiomarina xiamenensis]|uniref:diguanylate cyclase n=1 Tax=Idiomarina xiamenensis 10-D-4 TaxID=740709 RepID=K2JBL8_9GAMM|nr:diguanylate cyclase [Idiomarina xiamenensis]EKE80641.1 diguanylate cyclase [Idiomarina xiamenensis 10-D-4]
MLRKRNLVIFGGILPIYLVLVLVTTNTVVRLLQTEQEDKLREQVRQEISLAKSRLEANLYRDIFLADSLATVLTIDPQRAIANWQSIAQRLLSKAHQVRNVGIAPNDVISHNYPIEGNEKAIGLDFRNVPEQYRTVQKARQQGDVFIAGPLPLVQGGTGLIARYPIFTDYPNNENYWGTASVVIDYDLLFALAGFADINQAQIAIRGVDGAGANGAIFYGQEQTFEEADFTLPISIPNGEWLIGIHYNIAIPSKQQQALLFVKAIIFVFALLLFFSVFSLWRAYQLANKYAMRDELTQLPNRRYAMKVLQDTLSSRKAVKPFSLLLIDLNDFKEVNDNYGHDAGDKLLQFVSKLLLRSTPKSAIVTRLGGDEFLVILPNKKQPAVVASIIAKIKANASQSALRWHDARLYPSLSIGSALYQTSGDTLEDLLRAADQSMYIDKSKKNQ